MKPTLYGMHVSPWTRKARWALDHHGVGYKYAEHLPGVGELWLRVVANKPSGKISVPLLVTPHGSVQGSSEIARHAERISNRKDAEPLIPDGSEADIEKWTKTADRLIDAGRAFVLTALASNREAQMEAIPQVFPRALRGAFAPAAKMTANMLAKKWSASKSPAPLADDVMRPCLVEVREAIARDGGKPYLLDAFSLADITVATALQCVSPVSEEIWPLGPATRETWTNDALAADFEDVLAWRDRIFQDHYKRKSD